MKTVKLVGNIRLKQMHRYRLKTGQTFIKDFKDWKAAWDRPNFAASFDEAYTEWKNSMNQNDTMNIPPIKTLGCKTVAAPTPPVDYLFQVMAGMANQEQEKESTMCYAQTAPQGDTRTEAQQAKDYLIKSLDHEIRVKDVALAEAFHLYDTNGGLKTFGDLRNAIKDGWVMIYPDYAKVSDDEVLYDNARYLISVQDPDKLPDREGYTKALKAMKAEASDVKDQIVVFGAEKGLEALNEFKAKTYH